MQGELYNRGPDIIHDRYVLGMVGEDVKILVLVLYLVVEGSYQGYAESSSLSVSISERGYK